MKAEEETVHACWEFRGCDEEMQQRCPHNTPSQACPANCYYAACYRNCHVVCTDFNMLLNPERNYDAAVREICRFCEYFLQNGPKTKDRPSDFERTGNPNRFLL